MIYLESGLSENIKQGTKYMWYTNGHANENILKSKPSPVHEVANCFLHNAHVKCFDELSQLKKVWDNIWYIPWVSNIVIHFYNEFIFVVGVYMCHCGYYMQVSGS